jgi:hypothetical protein
LEVIVHDTAIHTNLQAFLVAIPLLLVLLVGLFRLDTLFAASRRRNVSWRPPSGIDKDGVPILCDPDGRRQSASRPLRK